MNRNNKNELITDVYRAKLVYQAEMKSPEYRAEGEEEFEFIGKALAAKGYRKAEDVAREVIDEFERRLYSVSHRETSITGYSYSVVDIDEIAYEAEELKKKYTEDCNG